MYRKQQKLIIFEDFQQTTKVFPRMLYV